MIHYIFPKTSCTFVVGRRAAIQSFATTANNAKIHFTPPQKTAQRPFAQYILRFLCGVFMCLQSRANEVHLELEIVFHPLRERSKCTHTHKTHRFATRLRFAEKNRRLGKVRRAVFVFKRTQAERGCGGGGHLVDCGLLLGWGTNAKMCAVSDNAQYIVTDDGSRAVNFNRSMKPERWGERKRACIYKYMAYWGAAFRDALCEWQSVWCVKDV